MKAFSIFIFAFLFSTFAFGQTKLIAFKSHSGKAKNFKKSLRTNRDFKGSDFGLRPSFLRIDTIQYHKKSGLVIGKGKVFYGREEFAIDTLLRNTPNTVLSKDSVIAKLKRSDAVSNSNRELNRAGVVYIGFEEIKKPK